MGAGRLAQGSPSATAQRVAVRRAAHQLIDQPRVFEDPLALRVIGQDGADELQRQLDDRHSPWNQAMRAFMATRSRYAEDRLALAYQLGVRQYVVLGAGLDTFACRNPNPDLKVFEVDHPSTQAWKRARLKDCGVEPTAGLTFAPIDFQTQGLAEGLAAAGFEPGRPAFISWLGVAMYLTDEAVFQTLGYVARLPTPSEIVFDFIVTPEQMSERSRMAAQMLAQGVAALGEPFRSAFDPAALIHRMLGVGFSQAETLGALELNRLYFEDRGDGLKLTGSGRLARARV